MTFPLLPPVPLGERPTQLPAGQLIRLPIRRLGRGLRWRLSPDLGRLLSRLPSLLPVQLPAQLPAGLPSALPGSLLTPLPAGLPVGLPEGLLARYQGRG